MFDTVTYQSPYCVGASDWPPLWALPNSLHTSHCFYLQGRQCSVHWRVDLSPEALCNVSSLIALISPLSWTAIGLWIRLRTVKIALVLPIQNSLVQWVQLRGNRGSTGWRPLNIWGLWICGAPQMEACEYVGHPFYQGVNAIVITLLWGVGLHRLVEMGRRRHKYTSLLLVFPVINLPFKFRGGGNLWIITLG